MTFIKKSNSSIDDNDELTSNVSIRSNRVRSKVKQSAWSRLFSRKPAEEEYVLLPMFAKEKDQIKVVKKSLKQPEQKDWWLRYFCSEKFETNKSLFHQVSWVRHRDIHLLTVGRYTYTSDQRFEAQHKPRSEEWALRIRSPQRRDSGQYECQISTTPPIGHAVFLNIVEPETEILGGPDLFIYAGSTINLTCIVRHTPEPPNTINWTHRGKTINFDSTRGGISLVTEKGIHSSSRLLVQAARTSDAGAYQCAPDNAQMATARVHVLTGEF
ncbi:uncharacterized protein LOC114350377 [Ostrinia furnacalis]|uniref:uncharacterized protein LOC114350377 n=1 Tax=Ostrinia furnacalis TaxID=93504 RepID=UPI001039B61F|nr:uncharacterized protein LOC114350377 [Ostrinia furnacalis]